MNRDLNIRVGFIFYHANIVAMFPIIFLLILSASANEHPCKDVESVDISNGEILKNGSIQDGFVFPPNYVYFKNVNGESRTFGCLCKLKECFRKCCPLGYVMFQKNCTKMEHLDGILNNGLDLYDQNNFLGKKKIEQTGFGLVFGKPYEACYLEDSSWFIQKNGSLYVEIEEGVSQWYSPDKYCIDHFVSSANDTSPALNALICFTSKPEPNHYMLSSSCMLISCFFIILTLAVYAWLPDLQNLHGLVLMAYLSSFFVGFIFLAIMQILLHCENITGSMCLSFTFIIYFSLLAAFFWLNVMCFDIWWTFSGKRHVSNRPSATKRRFLSYCVYAFGLPSVMTILLIILEFSFPPTTSYLLPRIASQGCFLYGRSRFIYLYVPMIILCVVNLIFFILTAVKIAEIKKQTKVLNNQDKQRFSLYIKLFIVMGVNWILEVASSFTDENNIIWRFTDAYNVLVGLIIFIIFVCKKKIWHKIKQRVESCSWTNTDEDEMKDINRNVNNININRWKNGNRVRGSIDTIKTTLGTDVDSLKSVRSSHLPQGKQVMEENFCS